jgi:hypothetical protein
MGMIGCPETSLQNYDSALRDIPEERTSHLHRGGSLKSHKVHGLTVFRRQLEAVLFGCSQGGVYVADQ